MALAPRVTASALLIGLIAACSGKQTSERPAFAATLERAGVDGVLILTPDTNAHAAVVSGFRQETGSEFDSMVRLVDEDSTPEEIVAAIRSVDPVCIVLLDNRTVELYREAVLTAPAVERPAIILMASYLKDVYLPRVPGSTGISYEIPAVGVYLRLRSITRRLMTKVGVLYRPGFESFIQRQSTMADIEDIRFEAIQTTESPTPREVREHIRTLIARGVESIWVLNDNQLLSPRLLLEGWKPALRGVDTTVVVGVESLIKNVEIGNFAMLPNHAQIGMQAADMLYRLSDAQWRVDSVPAEEPFGVESVLRLNSETEEQTGDVELQGVDRVYEGSGL